ncbi:hypothetical protein GCM10027591_00010 [Zhihengliuella somnathii]
MPRLPGFLRGLTKLRRRQQRGAVLRHRDYSVEAPGEAIGGQGLETLHVPATGDRRDLALVATDELVRTVPSLGRLPYSARLGTRYAYVGHGAQLSLGGARLVLGGATLDGSCLQFRLVALSADAEFPPVLTLIRAREQHVPTGFRQTLTCWPVQEGPHGSA